MSQREYVEGSKEHKFVKKMSQCSSIILEKYRLSQNVAKEEKKEIQLQLVKNRPYFSFEPTQ